MGKKVFITDILVPLPTEIEPSRKSLVDAVSYPRMGCFVATARVGVGRSRRVFVLSVALCSLALLAVSSLCVIDEARATGKGKGLDQANPPAQQQTAGGSDARPVDRAGSPKSRPSAARSSDGGSGAVPPRERGDRSTAPREGTDRQPAYGKSARRGRSDSVADRRPATSRTAGGRADRPVEQPPAAHRGGGYSEPPGQARRGAGKAGKPTVPTKERHSEEKPAASNGRSDRSAPAGKVATEPPGQTKKAEGQQPAAPPEQVEPQVPTPGGDPGGGVSPEDGGAITRSAPADRQAIEEPRSSYGASPDARPSGVRAQGDERRFGGSTLEAPLVAEAGTERTPGIVDRTVVSAAERDDVPRGAGLPEENGEENAPVSGYFSEPAGTVLEPLRSSAAALLGWTERVTASVFERTVGLLESVYTPVGHQKQAPPERAPPLPPGSGSSGSAFSGTGFGQSGIGLLLVLLSLLIMLTHGGRFWPPYKLLGPRQITRPVSERPG